MPSSEELAEQPLLPLPSWLHQPPANAVRPPVETRPQSLPLGELRWDDFERLCVALVKLEAEVEYCQRFGTPGQAQGGIDLYARLKDSNGYGVYQCKKVARFGPAAIRKAVSLFENGPWAHKASSFTLCISIDGTATAFATEYESQTQNLKSKGVEFPLWDANEISTRLKNHPNLVDDFFGRQWVSRFIGTAAADALETRLKSPAVTGWRGG